MPLALEKFPCKPRDRRKGFWPGAQPHCCKMLVQDRDGALSWEPDPMPTGRAGGADSGLWRSAYTWSHALCRSKSWLPRALICLGGPNRIVQAGLIKRKKFVFSGVQDHDVGKTAFSRDLSCWLADGHLLPAASHRRPSVCLCVDLFCKDTRQIGVRPTLMASF